MNITIEEIQDNLYDHKNISVKCGADASFKVRVKTSKQLWIINTNDIDVLHRFLLEKGVKKGELISCVL